MRKLTHEEIVSRQAGKLNGRKLPVCVVLNNIRSLHNVGTIFRTADGAGVSKIWLCGITGYPPQGGIAKTALGAENHVPWEYRESIVGLVQELKEQGYQIVLLEQMKGSINHDIFKPRFPVCLVIGNEVSGVADALPDLCDAAIEIEMDGIKNSLNVAVAFGIAAYRLRSAFKLKRIE
ncbi:MAG: RNA methyltransferase [Candidatus Omnitrophica bacterium]|nr:RNA methyltransferase [Candidatus Omnitrophota bacterium]MDE2222522.1 RNA methyltransferase [Candidatus Omnitrophota bacterium]